MAETKQNRKGSFREWLSKLFSPFDNEKPVTSVPENDRPELEQHSESVVDDYSSTNASSLSPEIKDVATKNSFEKLGGVIAPDGLSTATDILQDRTLTDAQISSTEIEEKADTEADGPVSLNVLTDELQQLFRGKNFEPLIDALKEDGITTVEQLRMTPIWVFLNRHNLYPIAERLSVLDYIQNYLNSDVEVDGEEVILESKEIQDIHMLKTENESEGELVEFPAEEDVMDIPDEEVTDDSKSDDGINQESTVVFPHESITYGDPLDEGNDAPALYYELYSVDPDNYRTYLIDDCDFSVRVSKRLKGMKLENVGDLLEQSDSIMLSISGFGANSIKELHSFFEKLVSSQVPVPSPTITNVKLTNELVPYREKLRSGDFTFTDNHKFSVKSQKAIKQIRDAHELIDQDLINSIANGEPAALAIIEMLAEFVTEHDRQDVCTAIIQAIPKERTQVLAESVIRAYTSNEEIRSFFRSRNYSLGTLEQFIYANADLIAGGNTRITKFLNWCEFDIKAEIDEFFDKQLENERTRKIFCGRVRGDTLAQLGDELGVTRERVRQIEAKVGKKAQEWFLRNRVAYKIFLDIGVESTISEDQIEKFIGQYGKETVSLLKECSGKGFFFDDRLGLFSIGKPLDYDGMQDYIDSLPDIFVAEELDSLIDKGSNKCDCSKDLLRLVFDGSYRRTGDTYHRSRLTLASVYGETMKKYYPNGIHIDDEEIAHFRELVQNEYGIDLSDKNVHSVSSIISRISILCGRGKYCLKSEGTYLSEKLIKQIRDYVERSTTPIMLFSTVFSEFEDELRSEGINNRYHLQGILKEIFGDTWYFKRDYISTDPQVTSFYDAVVSFIAKAKTPVSKEEVLQQFPGITDIVINLAVSGSDTINLFGSYINTSRLTLSEDDIQYFHKKIEEALASNEICYTRDLFNVIRYERPGLLSRNFITAGFGLYSVLEYLFGDNYNFSRPFIARDGAEIKSILSVLKEMVEEADVIEISTITSFASEHNYPIPSVVDFADSCNKTHLMINAQELASFEYIGVNEEIAKRIEQLILPEISEATPISNLTCIGKFPPIKVDWNAWLVYSVLKKWSRKLDVGLSKALFRIAYPVVAPAGMTLDIQFDESISHNGELISADNLDSIEDLIADYITDELGDIDEF